MKKITGRLTNNGKSHFNISSNSPKSIENDCEIFITKCKTFILIASAKKYECFHVRVEELRICGLAWRELFSLLKYHPVKAPLHDFSLTGQPSVLNRLVNQGYS